LRLLRLFAAIRIVSYPANSCVAAAEGPWWFQTAR
jgi:hypothetical protein